MIKNEFKKKIEDGIEKEARRRHKEYDPAKYFQKESFLDWYEKGTEGARSTFLLLHRRGGDKREFTQAEIESFERFVFTLRRLT